MSPGQLAAYKDFVVKIVAIRGEMAAVKSLTGCAGLVRVDQLTTYDSEAVPFDAPVDSPSDCNPNEAS